MRAALFVLACVMASSCGGGQTNPKLFSDDWEDDQGATIARVQRKLAGARPAAGADVVVAVGGQADKLVGVPLVGGGKWTFAHPLDARPIISGGVVIGSGGGEAFALDATSGKKLWARATGGLALRGAGDDGSVTVLTFSQATGTGSTLLAVLHNGTVVRQIETEKSLGAPAVLQGMAFVPWGTEYVSVIDLSNGDESARVTLRESTSRAWTEGGALYFGGVGFFRFDERIKLASKNQASHIGPCSKDSQPPCIPSRELPGTPALMPSGYDRVRAVADAHDKIRVFARPSPPADPASAMSLDSSRFYATYFKIAMGFDANKGALVWVHTHASDIVGGTAANGGLAACDEQGKVTFIDATSGAVVDEKDLAEPIRACVVQADGFKVMGKPRDPKPFADQLTIAITNGDAQLVTAQRLLMRELATLDDELATKTLVDLASDVRTPPELLIDARTALANRRSGASFMLEALGRHYDFLKDVLRAPPVGPMAQSLAAMKATQAGPLIASHLLDPADTDDDVRRSAEALITLATPAEMPTLKQFFAMYRATAQSDMMQEAVVSVGQAMLRVGGAEGRAAVDFAIKDSMTAVFVKERLQAIEKVLDAEKAPGK